MHLASRAHNFWGGYAIVGGHLPLATGIALKCKYNSEPNVVLCYCGDGASNNGYFHEALNMAAVWDLPVVWLIENNLVGMGTRIEDSTGQPEIVKRAIAYGMKEGPRVDGQDVIAVYEAVREAVEYARTSGPVLMEALTYRYKGHGVSDKSYDSRENMVSELQTWQARDPIHVLRDTILEAFGEAAADLTRLEAEAVQIVDEAVQFALESPAPDYNDLINNVYVGRAWNE
jgi:pyruvate dehydrogenase E1 component alpha subunit